MTLTIGRATNLRVRDFTRSGNTIRASGVIIATNAVELDARRQQLAGLVDNPDEPTVPLTWTVDHTQDGFYRNVQVDLGRFGVERSGYATFSLSADRVSGYAQPLFEVVYGSVVRANAFSVTAPSGVISFAPDSFDNDLGGTLVTTSNEDGNVRLLMTTAPVAPSSTTFAGPPASYYVGQCKIEVSYDSGVTWYPLVGQQMPSTVGAYWRISNGCVRMSPNGTAVAGADAIKVERYLSSSGWSGFIDGTYGAGTFNMQWNAFSTTVIPSVGTYAAPAFTRIIRNSPEMVIIRTRQPGSAWNATMDWSIRRGDWWVEVNLLSGPQGSVALGMRYNGASAALNAFSNGYAFTSANDAAGRRWGVMSTVAATTSNLGGGVQSFLITTKTSASQQLAFTVDAAHAFSSLTLDSQYRDAFYAARYEQQRVVAR